MRDVHFHFSCIKRKGQNLIFIVFADKMPIGFVIALCGGYEGYSYSIRRKYRKYKKQITLTLEDVLLEDA